MSTKRSAGRVRVTYAFIKANESEFSTQTMCRVLGVAPAWGSWPDPRTSIEVRNAGRPLARSTDQY